MKYGFYLPHNGPTAKPGDLKHIAQKGDSLGFDCMVVGDHVMVPRQSNSQYPYSIGNQVPWGEDGEHLEQLTELTFLAGITEHIRIVPSVMIVPYRNPLLTAKMLATMDVLSEGRLTVGVGVGWLEEEFEALDTPPFAERGAVTNEYILAFKELWTSDIPTFEGKYCQLSNISFSPKPVQKPHPPIWVGGNSRPAMRRAVELGDAWHPVGATPATPLEPEELSTNLEYIKRHADKIGRDQAEVEIAMKAPLYDKEATASGPRRRFSGTANQVAEDIAVYSDIGVGHLIFDTRSDDLSHSLQRMAWLAEDVMPQVN